MMKDELAHRRIDMVEEKLNQQFDHITKLETAIVNNTSSLQENTNLTKEIATNTAELVELFKGAKVFKKFIVWTASIITALTAITAFFYLLMGWFSLQDFLK